MEKIYYNLDEPAAFGSATALYNATKENNPSIQRKDVTQFLQSSDAYTRHRIQPTKFDRRFYMVSRPGAILGLDTAHMRKLCEYNDNINYLMIAIDMFSRFLIVIPMKSLKSTECVKTLDKIMDQSIYQYPKFFSDEGIEFINKAMIAEYQKHSIEIYHTYNRAIKCGVAERVIRTIKTKLYKYMTHTNTYRYIDVLQQVVDTYNVTAHRGIDGMLPFDLHLMSDPKLIDKFQARIYKIKCSQIKTISNPLTVGQAVRLQSSDSTINIFSKGYEPRNTREIFLVSERYDKHVPVTYAITDLEGEKIQGTWYHQELIPCIKPTIFNIEVIKSRRRKGRLEYFINYIDYPNSPATWVDKSVME